MSLKTVAKIEKMAVAGVLLGAIPNVRKLDEEDQAMQAPAKSLFSKSEIRLAMIAAALFLIVAGVSLFV